MRPIMDMVGRRVGRLVVIADAGSSARGEKQWLCRCDCGTEKILPGIRLRGKAPTLSCGCYAWEGTSLRSRKHGLSGTPEHNTWAGMISRCTCPTDRAYFKYGGRGIKVCDRWRYDFSAFLEDMGRKPSPRHSLDRINNDGDYCPENCRWATSKEQTRNARYNLRLTFGDVTRTLVEWAEVTGLCSDTIRYRYLRGWDIEQALTTPPRGGNNVNRRGLERLHECDK